MRDDWPSRFRSFALSIDTIDDINLEKVKERLKEYLCEVLQASFFRVSVGGFEDKVQGQKQPSLRTVWADVCNGVWDDLTQPRPTRRQRQGYESLTVYAYRRRLPLWITPVGSEKLTLAEAKRIHDLWSDAKKLPRYQDYGRADSKTSIVHPLTYVRRLFGVLCVEFPERLSPTDGGKEVITLLAQGLARVFYLHQTWKSQRKDTGTVFKDLKVNTALRSPLAPRIVFLASSGRADPKVMGVIRRVLESHRERFEVRDWEELRQSGNINEQIRRDIRTCEFGVCYLSEPLAEEGEPAESVGDRTSADRFVDNPNVLFEAGMMQMLHELREPEDASVSRWIPVRESTELTAAEPFDFRGERIVVVPRDGLVLDEGRLEEELNETIDRQLEVLKIR